MYVCKKGGAKHHPVTSSCLLGPGDLFSGLNKACATPDTASFSQLLDASKKALSTMKCSKSTKEN